MMKWLKEQNRLTREFIRGDFASTLWMAGVAFGVLMVLGLVLGLFMEELVEFFVGMFSGNIANSGIMDENGTIHMLPLLFNNLRASVLTICYGLIPFLFLPALSLGINSLLVGFFAAYYLTNGMSMLYFFAAIIPHGIVEFPALVVSIALGLYLCRIINDYARHSTKGAVKAAVVNILRVFCLRTTPMFILASVIESFVTPWILTLI